MVPSWLRAGHADAAVERVVGGGPVAVGGGPVERREQSNLLVREVPEEECQSLPAYGAGRSQTADERWDLIRDLCQKHRGEVREINGSWRYMWAPFPTEGKFFHAQHCLTYQEAEMRTTWTGTGKPASGGKGAGKPAPSPVRSSWIFVCPMP